MRPLLSTLLIFAIATPLAAQDALDDFEWTQVQFTPFEPSDMGLALLFGLPQSDWILLHASCLSPAPGQSTIRASVSADPGTAIEGQPVWVEFDGLTNALPVIGGQAVGIGAEIGITGAMIETDTNGPLWDHLATTDTIRYRIRGQQNWVELPGAPDEITAFRSNCLSLSGAAPRTPPAASEPGPTHVPTCADLPGLVSTETGDAQEIAVINDSAFTARVIWLDPTGNQIDVGVLAPGQTASLGSDKGHIWVIANAAGVCQSVHEARAPEIRIADPADNAATSPEN
ncbi:MAG: hypothetical protein AAGF88_07715 [Pseudomonadota bacterium]